MFGALMFCLEIDEGRRPDYRPDYEDSCSAMPLTLFEPASCCYNSVENLHELREHETHELRMPRRLLEAVRDNSTNNELYGDRNSAITIRKQLHNIAHYTSRKRAEQ